MSEKIKGLCHGVFDIIHAGHIEHLRRAKSLVDWLIVSITADEFVNKGPGRLAQTAEKAKIVLEAINFIDEVVVSRSHTAVDVINEIKPQIYFKGEEYYNESQDLTGNMAIKERQTIEKNGGKIVYTSVSDSSSRIIKLGGLARFSKVQKDFIQS